MSGYQRTAEDTEPAYPATCGVSGCGKKTVVNIQRNGISVVTRCASHYLAEADRAGKSADGNPIQPQLHTELDELREMGLDVYRQEARQRQKAVMEKMQKPEMKPKTEKVPDQEYFGDSRGIEDLMRISAKRGGREWTSG